jgi:hypothetical protein
MKKVILSIGLAALLSGSAIAQTSETRGSASGSNKTSVKKSGRDVSLQSGTQLSGQLQNTLDVQRARVGDQVVLKTTSAVKQNGRVVVDKGSRLVGRVTEVQQRSRGNAESRVGILFDRLENGKMTLPINAVITSVTQARAGARADDVFESDVSGSSSTRASSRSQSSGNSSGGLLGGVTNTVGGVVNSTTQTVGGVTNTVGETVGNTTQSVGRTVRGIQISQSASASAEGSSTLSLTGGNLRLEKGTTLNLRLTESASIGGN